MIHLLAEVAAASPDTMISGKWLLAAIPVVAGALFGGHRLGRQQRVQIDGQPVAVKMEDHFVTRREFDTLKAAIHVDITEMKGLFHQTMQKIDTQSQNLTKDIRDMGTGAYNGRQKIWDQLNDQRERLGICEALIPAIPKRRAPGNPI